MRYHVAFRRTMRLTFWGAAGEVTGSMHLVEAAGKQILLDCGLHQGRRKETDWKNRHLPFPAASIDAVVLSHAHIDHSGNLPTLVKDGFTGPIYSTPATVDLCNWMLRDTAHIQEKDAEFLNKRREHRMRAGPDYGPVEPLYSMEDAERTLPQFQMVPYHHPQDLAPGLRYSSYDAGHILGSLGGAPRRDIEGAPLRLAFSGDMGRPHVPIIRSPEPPPEADYLILESTYGGRLHKSMDHVVGKLADVVNRTAHRGGRIIVPCFRGGPHAGTGAPAAPAGRGKADPQYPHLRRQPARREHHRCASRASRMLQRRNHTSTCRIMKIHSGSSACATSARRPNRSD